ncbi:MAG: hypothetical protein KAR35_07550 [Candidatus Heimdallarchaeota archaeon]|nr:hypothetical protein [Candidatus Heimdallarchaeota archaeon]MCK5049215.1 hypothetical protein [Candidatus Heimdallarchaeota archaeon]
MVFIGYSRYHCLVRGQMLDNFENIDEFEFDARVLASKNGISDINPYRFPSLESNYFGESYVELIFSFRISYKDKSPEINEYLNECADIMQDTVGMMVDEIDFEGITPDSL